MEEKEPTFKPAGQPLTEEEFNELATIRQKDLNAALKDCDPGLLEFLEAELS